MSSAVLDVPSTPGSPDGCRGHRAASSETDDRLTAFRFSVASTLVVSVERQLAGLRVGRGEHSRSQE